MTDAARLTDEITDRRYTVADKTVCRYSHRFRDGRAAPSPAPKLITVRDLTRWILTHPDHLKTAERGALTTILGPQPPI